MNTIIRGFRQVLNFKGRDRRGQFWPYAAIVMLINMVVSIVALIPGFVGMMNQTLLFAEQNPDKATVYRTPTSVHVQIHDPSGMPPVDVSAMMMPLGLVIILVVTLLAAAVTRRLHDRGLAGYWALIPVILCCAGAMVFINLFGQLMGGDMAEPDGAFIGQFLLSFVLILAYQASLLALVVVLALKGKTGPNRYGPEPV